MSTWIFYFGFLAGVLVALSIVSIPRPQPRVVTVSSLPRMEIATKYRRDRAR